MKCLAGVFCRRGKNNEKHYTVFVCKVQQQFEPILNYEHSAFRWFEATDVASLSNQHPVVKILFSEPHVKQLAAATFLDPDDSSPGRKIEKLGAGLFFV